MTKTANTTSPAEITHSAAHYLLAVGDILDERGYVRVSDIARFLHLTPGSVSVSMQSLCSGGFVVQDEHRFFLLTDKGRQAVRGIRARHEIVERFLQEVLCLSPEAAHRESCRTEHFLEAPTARALLALLRFWRSRGLGEALKAELDVGCPACQASQASECPSCALECLETPLPRKRVRRPEGARQ
jgi:Mn-dependent DtxR family transcriptional regulator